MARERQSQISLLGPSGPHEVRAFSATRLLLQKGFTTYITTQALPGCQLSQLTNVKHDLKGYYTIKREGGWFSITEISTSFCCTDCISQSPILLNNLLLSLISVLWTLNWKDHSYFICIRKLRFTLPWSRILNWLVILSDKAQVCSSSFNFHKLHLIYFIPLVLVYQEANAQMGLEMQGFGEILM